MEELLELAGCLGLGALFGGSESDEEKERNKKRNELQKRFVKFFLREGEGCLSSDKNAMKVPEFNERLLERIKQVTCEIALDKLNIDASEVEEIEPVKLIGHLYHNLSVDDKGYCRDDQEGDYIRRYVSNHQVTWLMFGADQFYVYQQSFNLTSDFVSERTEEYFYKDVTSFSTNTNSENIVEFSIVVPGDKFDCAIDTDNEATEMSIKGMKSLLREKKSV
ncbi:MAG: hypothetical protein MJZ34_15215 [Paludibacteraceae bacterium]|nr:hypothetical protein [Paludibacteraceae bacterium]